MGKFVWEPKQRYCTPGHARVLLQGALNEKQRSLSSTDDHDYEHAARAITFFMMDHDQDYGILPIFRSEVKRARDNISQLRRLLEQLIERVSDNAEKAALDKPEHTGNEGSGVAQERAILPYLESLRDGLQPYSKLFHSDLAKSHSWHVYAGHLFDAFKFSAPPRPSGQPWGLSRNGPAVRFIQAALSEILLPLETDGGRRRRRITGGAIASALAKRPAVR